MDRATRQKTNKEIEDLNNIINELDVTDIYSTLHPTKAEYTYFSLHMEYSTESIIGQAMKQVTINLK